MKEEEIQKVRKNGGITLIALVITIIVLLILAAVTIGALAGDNGILIRANEAKDKNKIANVIGKVELAVMGSYNSEGNIDITKLNANLKATDGFNNSDLNLTSLPAIVEVDEIDIVIKKNGKVSIKPIIVNKLPTTAVKEDTNYMDNYGNIITIPAGFKIAQDSGKNANEGIVIEDVNNGGEGNQFVWVPVGNIYTDAERTESNKKVIELSRYTFSNSGVAIKKDENIIDSYWQELSISENGNDTSKDIEEFKNSVIFYGGYYIGRYETGVEDFERLETTNSNNELEWTGYVNGKLVVQRDKQVYNFITQRKASKLSKAMYDDKDFTSDLINSYAWDTAIYFIQTCEDNTYSMKSSVLKTSISNTGMLKDETNYDVRCNIFDMSGNVLEFSTETSIYPDYPCVTRGGESSYEYYYTKSRQMTKLVEGGIRYGFRIILYL